MSNSQRISRLRNLFLGLLTLAVLALGTWFVVEGMENEVPTLTLESPVGLAGPSFTLNGAATDAKSGIKRVWAAILQEGQEVVLLDQSFPSQGVFKRGSIRSYPLAVSLSPRQRGLKDGEALLRIAVWDHSFKGWGTGNQLYEEMPLQIDTTPPVIEMVTRVHNLNQGGTGLAIYKTSEPAASTGVQVADRFFPGSAGFFEDPNVYLAYFALSHDQGPDTDLLVTAVDQAGNTSSAGFYRHINAKTFSKDSVHITEGFLKAKMPEFAEIMGWQGQSLSLIEQFLSVNRDLRQRNYSTLRTVLENSENKQHWQGPFLRLPASARRAAFADHRTYLYDGKPVDDQVHLGVDLASVAHSPVPAANSGRVVFAEYLGIYGKSVIVDHGFFLFSMYSHLNRIGVNVGQRVSKGDIIGQTGTTGMAGGDHLHFSMIVAHTFVNPLEWWDPVWITHNVTDKLKEAENQVGSGKKEAAT